MEFYLLPLLIALLCLILRESNASVLPAEVYWKSMLPNTPLPKALQELLTTDARTRSSFAEELDAKKVVAYQTHYWPNVKIIYQTPNWPKSKTFDKDHIFNTTTIFFLLDNLRPYKTMNPIFTISTNGSNFLPLKVARSIPFASSKLPEILNYTSIKSQSKEAQIMKQTIEECEAPGIKGEHKHCATSLESLVDFVVANFGKKVKTLSNEAEKENKKQEYVIQKGIQKMGENTIVCHKQRYAYAVYYCHTISHTNIYMVPMIGVDGSKAKAVVACHLDTSAWDPQHFAFQVLKVKPGGPPVCHFLNSDTIVWLPN